MHVYMDCIVVKVRQNGSVINKAAFLALGINTEGQPDYRCTVVNSVSRNKIVQENIRTPTWLISLALTSVNKALPQPRYFIRTPYYQGC